MKRLLLFILSLNLIGQSQVLANGVKANGINASGGTLLFAKPTSGISPATNGGLSGCASASGSTIATNSNRCFSSTTCNEILYSATIAGTNGCLSSQSIDISAEWVSALGKGASNGYTTFDTTQYIYYATPELLGSPVNISSGSRSGTTITIICASACGISTGESVKISGTLTDFDGGYDDATQDSSTQFHFTCSAACTAATSGANGTVTKSASYGTAAKTTWFGAGNNAGAFRWEVIFGADGESNKGRGKGVHVAYQDDTAAGGASGNYDLAGGSNEVSNPDSTAPNGIGLIPFNTWTKVRMYLKVKSNPLASVDSQVYLYVNDVLWLRKTNTWLKQTGVHNITSATRAANVLTIITADAHLLTTGDRMTLTGTTSFNSCGGNFSNTVVVDSATQYHLTCTGADVGVPETGTTTFTGQCFSGSSQYCYAFPRQAQYDTNNLNGFTWIQFGQQGNRNSSTRIIKEYRYFDNWLVWTNTLP
jgi:hypothetical protein